MVGHGGSPLCLSTCIHKHKLNFDLYACKKDSAACSLLSWEQLLVSRRPCIPTELLQYVAELPADAPGLLGAESLGGTKVKGRGFTERYVGIEGAELQPAVPWQAADGINACDLPASLFLEEKGKKKTRNVCLYAIKI